MAATARLDLFAGKSLVLSGCSCRLSLQEQQSLHSGPRMRLELLSGHESYRWLNASFLVGEGEIDEETEEWRLDAYVCMNEVAQHPPALGKAPPKKFSQADRDNSDAS
jgi:hypothetical protein